MKDSNYNSQAKTVFMYNLLFNTEMISLADMTKFYFITTVPDMKQFDMFIKGSQLLDWNFSLIRDYSEDGYIKIAWESV